MRRLLGCLGAAALLVGAGLLGAGPAAATPLPLDQCTTNSGAILAVDFGHWGGPIVRGCGSTPTTGFQLLNQGGWQSVGTQRGGGSAFICRISYSGYRGGTAYPSTAEDPCISTPSAKTYWSYWHADQGDSSWSYSQDGAQSYSPPPGSVDLWTYGAGTSPSVSPDALRAHNSSPVGGGSSAPAPHSSAPGGFGSGGSSSAGSGSGGSSGPGGSGGGAASGSAGSAGGSSLSRSTGPARSKVVAKASRSAASSTAASSASGTSPSGSGSIVNADPAAKPARHSSGSMVPGLITVGLVLGSIATAVGWRRRQGRLSG